MDQDVTRNEITETRNLYLKYCNRLYRLLACLNCGVLREEVFTNGNCDHFQCKSCLSDLFIKNRIKCGIHYPFVSSAECTKFFTKATTRPESYLNEKCKEALRLFSIRGFSLEEIVRFVPIESNTNQGNISIDVSKAPKSVSEIDENSNASYGKDSEVCNSSPLQIDTENEESLHKPKTKSFDISSQKEYECKAPPKKPDIFDMPLSQPGEQSWMKISNKGNNVKRPSNEAQNNVGHEFFQATTKLPKKIPVKKIKSNHVTGNKRKPVFENLTTTDQSSYSEDQSPDQFEPGELKGAKKKKKGPESELVCNLLRTSVDSSENENSENFKDSAITRTTNQRSLKRSLFDKSSSELNEPDHVEISGAKSDEIDEASLKKLTKRDGKGETELHRESKRGNLKKVEFLLDMGADPNTKDNANLRPLHEHKALENSDLCRLLLEYGADPRVHGGDNQLTPLHVAVQNDFKDAIPLLIQCGANIHAAAKTSDGSHFTPLSVAKFYEKTEIVKLLESEHEKYTFNQTAESEKPGDYVVTPLRKPKVNVSELLNKTASPNCLDGSINRFCKTSLTQEQLKLCALFAKEFKMRQVSNMEGGNSCVLVMRKKPNSDAYPRTHKAMIAMLTNGLLVDVSWVEKSLQQKQLLPFSEFLVDGLNNYKSSVKRAREAKTQSRKLLAGLTFFVRADVSVSGLSCSDIKDMLLLAGAKVLPREPKPENIEEFVTNELPDFISQDSKIKDIRVAIVTSGLILDNKRLFFQVIPGFYHVTFEWIMSCVCSFSVIDKFEPELM